MTTIAPPSAPQVCSVESGPERVRSEYRWKVRLDNGERGVLAQLLPEVAHDESMRRRYIYEAERLRDLGGQPVAPVLAIGPEPDPRAVSSVPPWRLRSAPTGRTLADWLILRAPAPLD